MGSADVARPLAVSACSIGGALGNPMHAMSPRHRTPSRHRGRTTARPSWPSAGPRNAKPTANEPWSVRLKTLIAISSCAFGTTRGIIEPSAGVSATLIRLMPRLSARTIPMFIPASARPAVSAGTNDVRDDERPAKVESIDETPANGDSAICGRTNETRRALTALFERVGRKDEDGQRIERHVAADLVGGLDEPQAREDRVAHDRAGRRGPGHRGERYVRACRVLRTTAGRHR